MRFSGVVFLDADDVERAHDAAMAMSGGSAGLRDRGLLESATAAPSTTVFGAPAYPTLATMAAALAYALAKNHAFVDGNKRAAMMAVVIFLDLNGISVPLQGAVWEETFTGLADGRVTREDFARLLIVDMGADLAIEMD